MNNNLTQFDHYLANNGPAALVLREHLVPVEGPDGVVFPATFAAGEGFPGGYNIDGDLNGENIALIDSVGSQSNRIEPMFAEDAYKKLVPQVIIKAGDKSISILQAGHRAGDAIVRCSALQQELQDAFKKLLNGDATPLAKIAPTSLVFGVWDSRDTQAKMPRLIASTIRAYDVRKLTRSAQYVPATDYVGSGLLDEPAEKATKDAYAQRGFVHVPATYLVCYDIADDKRLRKVFKTCGNFGDHLQFSVFECDLNPSEKIELETVLSDIINHDEDQVIFVGLGPSEGRGDRVITAIGLPYMKLDAPCYVV